MEQLGAGRPARGTVGAGGPTAQGSAKPLLWARLILRAFPLSSFPLYRPERSPAASRRGRAAGRSCLTPTTARPASRRTPGCPPRRPRPDLPTWPEPGQGGCSLACGPLWPLLPVPSRAGEGQPGAAGHSAKKAGSD